MIKMKPLWFGNALEGLKMGTALKADWNLPLEFLY
jgi:hypothetical protein